MHRYDDATDELAWRVFRYALNRIRGEFPLDGPRTPEQLRAAVGETVTAAGLGGDRALDLFATELATACISVDHPRFLSFVPGAPTEAAVLFDLVVGASSFYGGSWLEGAGAVFAENQALRWVADLAGLPASAGGVFVPGGTTANLSALVAARHRRRAGGGTGRAALVASESAHSSIETAAKVMDVEVLWAQPDGDGRLTGDGVRAALAASSADLAPFAVVATAGSTNLGIVDRLASVADAAHEAGLWLHVDGAYGGAALAAPSARDIFAGVERCDSIVVDPHKWLFAPYDCAALLYRQPELARVAHTQHAGYLDPITTRDEWNPADYAVGLTRRARGLPFWFSLAVHGTDAYRDAVETTLAVARDAAAQVRAHPALELVREPDLSVVAFRRLGWTMADYTDWSDRQLAEQTAFVVPTTVDGEPALRFCVVNPRTTSADIALILATLT
jgi:glutamate/tyrosine decarboxylase-like PLP-dependent enzyme